MSVLIVLKFLVDEWHIVTGIQLKIRAVCFSMLNIKHTVFLHSRQGLSCSPGPSVFISAAGEIDMFFSGNQINTKKYFVLSCLNL